MTKRVANLAMDKRLQRWGEWRTGARAYPPNMLARLREGAISSSGDRRLIPFVDLEAWETDAAIKSLPADRQRLLRAVYPRTADRARRMGLDVEALTSRLNDVHRLLGRAFKQRRAGETVDPQARRKRLAISTMTGTSSDGRVQSLAAVQVEEGAVS